MKIALIRQRYTPFGGAERFVERAVQALSAEGATLTIVTRQWQDNAGPDALICNPPYMGSLWRDWGFARCVCKMLGKASFDLVQSHERIACCDVFRAGDGVHREWLIQRRRILGTAARVRLLLNPYHYYVLRAEEKLFSSSRLKAVICISRMVKDDILRHYDVPQDKLHVIYNGVDTRAFHPERARQQRSGTRAAFNIPEDASTFLFVGSGFERKGLKIALDALASLPQTAHLLVVGKDKQLEVFQRYANSLGIAGRTHFVGGQDNVLPFYGAADALVFPTLYEPFGNVVLEALACGLPVITSSKSGAAELIAPGINGFVCDPLDPQALANQMGHWLHPDACRTAGVAARQTAEAFDLERMSATMLALYNRLISAHELNPDFSS